MIGTGKLFWGVFRAFAQQLFQSVWLKLLCSLSSTQVQGWKRLCTQIHGEQLERHAEGGGPEVKRKQESFMKHCPVHNLLYWLTLCVFSLRMAVQEDLEEEKKEEEERKQMAKKKRKNWLL